MAALDLDAIVLADDPLASVRIAGLTARERALRVARRVGATRVFVIDTRAARDELVAWRADRTCALLVIRADQFVHIPLAAPLVAALPTDGVAIAVGPDDHYAGAYVATGVAARRAVGAIANGDNNAAFVGAADAARIPHGAIARHSIATPEERVAAERLLFQIIVKPQDNVIARYLFRPISSRLTRLLVKTPITPNQVSAVVAVLVLIGCWLTAHGSANAVIEGTGLILASAYLDCCDGEIARLKMMSSRAGAWVDTIVDELSTVGYMVALGIHCHLAYGEPGLDVWLALVILGVITIGWSIYCIYFNIITAVGSANSQDYIARFELVPGATPTSVRLRPVVAVVLAPTRTLPPVVQGILDFIPNVIRRDFITWAAFGLAVAHLTHVSFVLQVLGGVISATVCTRDHLHLRRLRRSAVASGHTLESARAS